jgi:hypothetical protein
MTTTTGTGRKRATKALQQASTSFIENFLSAMGGAMQLRSKEPGICWKASGQVAFAVIGEFAGPNTMAEDTPLLLRLRTNMYPPPAIYYHLRSPAVCCKLGVMQPPLLATDPAFELTALPSEIAQLGKWFTAWLDGKFYQSQTCPRPPVPLVSWRADDGLVERQDDVMTLGRNWKDHMYLWTPKAISEFKQWLNKD